MRKQSYSENNSHAKVKYRQKQELLAFKHKNRYPIPCDSTGYITVSITNNASTIYMNLLLGTQTRWIHNYACVYFGKDFFTHSLYFGDMLLSHMMIITSGINGAQFYLKRTPTTKIGT